MGVHLGSRPSSAHSLRVLRMTSVHPSGAVGPEIPWSPRTGRTAQTLHWTTGGLAGGLQSFIRYMVCKHLVPFWMVDYLIPCSFYTQLFFILRKSNSSILSFVACAFGSRSKKSWLNPRSWRFTLMFSSTSFIILVLASRPLVHFALIFVYGVRGGKGPSLFFCMWVSSRSRTCANVWEKIRANDATNKGLILKYTNSSYNSKKKKNQKTGRRSK